MRYNLKIYFAMKIHFNFYIEYYNMHYNKYKLRIYFIYKKKIFSNVALHLLHNEKYRRNKINKYI